MIKKFLQKAAAFVLCTVCFLAFAPDAAAAQLQGLPGQELWQPYLEKAPQSAESFAKDPLKSLLALLPGSPAEMIRQMAHCYADVLLFLLLLIVLSFLVGGAADSALLELAAAVGCGTLLWGDLISLAQLICERMEGWKNYLLGFLPAYSGVLAAGGEVNASAAASGLLLTGLCFLAQGTVLVVSPLLQSYLAVSMACCISTQQGLSETCRVMGALLHRGLVWAGRIFAVLLGLQRAVTVQLDRSALRLGQLLTGGVPVIGQALSDTAEVFLAGMQLLKSSLGFAALAVIGAEFLPLYLQLLLHLLFLAGCRLLCGLAENRRCQALFDCMAEAVKCMAAVTALFLLIRICRPGASDDDGRRIGNARISDGGIGVLHCLYLCGDYDVAGGRRLGGQMHKSRCRAIYSSDPVPAGPADEAGTEKCSGGCSGSGQHPEYGDIALAGNAGTAGSGSLRRV